MCKETVKNQFSVKHVTDLKKMNKSKPKLIGIKNIFYRMIMAVV